VLGAYDAFLRDAPTVEQLAPDLVLRFGALPTSKPVVQYLQRFPDARHLVVDPGGWREPTGLASDVLHVDPAALCAALRRELDGTSATGDWLARWLTVEAAAARAIGAHLAAADELFEGRVFTELLPRLPPGALLFAGNSMPVRDLDSFLSVAEPPLRCLANRGANGIDGVVSSALGASAAGVGPTVLVIGDVSFYHDLNGLLAAAKHDLDLLVILVNNDGGGIFSFLPQAEADALGDAFETLFGTPHGLAFRPFVEAYGGKCVRVASWPEFRAAVDSGLAAGGLQVVEVPTERRRNVEQHRAVWRAVGAALQPAAVA
jgi:2-succinyl-5-enolpyruvyl-6-hydroxy-3-cyclohexene-1-carboxylate synthase